MNCIVCDCFLPNCCGSENQPIGGTEFTSAGHYGSTVTDHMDGTKHVINVCDKCLIAAKERGACEVVEPKSFAER